MRGRTALKSILLAALVCLLAAPAYSQGRRGQQQGQQGQGRRGRQQMSQEERDQRMQEFRQRAMERMKEQLGIKDDAEFAVFQKRLEAVQEAERDLRGGRFGFGGFGGRGNRGGPGGGRRPGGDTENQTEVGKCMQALQEVTQKENPKNDEIKKALSDLRAARKKAEKKLEDAQTKLREVCTLKQEAILVGMGRLR